MPDHGSESEPGNPLPGSRTASAMSNRDWWPNQPNQQILHQPSPRSDPMARTFSYAEEFKTLDVEALKRDIIELMTTA